MLAIVIPYFKLTFFEETLESLANQTDKRFKAYIGNDASPEDPSLLLEKYKDKIDFKYQRFDSNLGSTFLVRHWERCINLVDNEEWIMILGDDDVLGDNVVAQFFKNLIDVKTSHVIRFASCKIDKNGINISKIYNNPKNESSIDFLFRETRSSLSEYIFKKSQIDKVRFKNFPLAWFSDVLGVLEFSNFGNVFSINEAVVYIRITHLSISGNNTNLSLKSIAKFKFYYYLLNKKYNHFNRFQIESLFEKLNKCYLNDKKNVLLFIKISKIYILNMKFKMYLGFLKKILISIKNR